MAVAKKTAQSAQNDTQQAETDAVGKDTAERETPVTEPHSGAADDYTKYVYVGPSLPGGRLKSNAIFEGTKEEIKTFLADVITEYPQIKSLIVPVHQLGEASAKAQTKGNILNKYCNDILSAVNSRKKEA